MIDRIIEFSVKNKFTVLLMVLVLIVWGSWSLSKLPVDAVPDVTNNQVEIITNSPSLASLEIERFITAPIEMQMSNIPGLVEVRSISKFGLSVVKLVFTDQTDIYWARQQVFERLEAVKSEIPEELGKPFMGPTSTGLGEVFQYVIRPKNPKDKSFSMMDIRTLQDWQIRKQLLGIPGIAEVNGFGGYKKEYQAILKPNNMRALNVSIDELFDALSAGNSNTGGAYIEKNNRAFTIRGVGLASSLEEIGNTVIKLNGRVPVLVKDIADVEYGHCIRYGAMSMNGNGETVGGIIMMMRGANSKEVIERIKAKMKEIEKGLPEGLMIEPFIDREKIVTKAIQTVYTNLIEGSIIVVFVIILFLGDLRASLLSASLIPLAMLFAFGMMYQFGVVGNIMSLGAIDFGLIVDSGIIVVESIVLQLAFRLSSLQKQRKLSLVEREEVVIHATKEVKKSVVFGGLIILIVYFPLLTLTGIEGKMFIPMAQTVSFAILGALILAITYVPMMSALILKPSNSHGHGFSERIIQFVFRFYEPVLKFALRKKVIVLLVTLAILVSGGIGFSVIGGEFIPKLAEGDIVIETNLPVGTSLTESLKLSDKIQTKLLAAFPDEIERVVSKIGTSEVPVDPMPLESQEVVVVLSDKKVWKKAKEQEELSAQISELMAEFPGVIVSVQQPIENRVNEMMSGARTDVVVKLYGPDLDSLVKKSNQIISIIKTIPGAADVQENKIFGLPQINIKYNRARMAFYGITVAQINRTIQSAFAGAVAGTVYENDKRFDLTLRLSGEERERHNNLRNLLLNDKDNNPIPLHQVADITEDIGPSEIGHDNLERRSFIGFNVRGRDLASVVDDAIKKVNEKVVLPKGYKLNFGGEYENFQRAKQRLAIVVPLALLIIFGLLYATFGNAKDSLLIYTVVPLSAIGGVFSLLIRDMNFSISAGVGFIALFGVAVLNGILLVSHFNGLDAQGISDPTRRVLHGIREKFRPILMTSMVAALGFIPMAVSTSAGAEVQRPLATVVIGGLLTATVLTLFVLPVLYVLFKSKKNNPPKLNTEVIAVLLLIVFLVPGKAQNFVSLPEAISLAVKNNPETELADQKIDQQKSLRASTYNFDNTQLLFEAPTGTELRPGILQTFQYPGVYAAQHKSQKSKIQVAESEKEVNVNYLVYRVRNAYNEVQFQLERVRLLARMDSIYSSLLVINDVRYRVGQISNLEKINGEAEYRTIEYSLAQARAALKDSRIQLGLLLGKPNDTTYLPSVKLSKISLSTDLNYSDTSAYRGNPMLRYQGKVEQYQIYQLKVQKRRRIPGLMIGYLNQGNDNTTPLQYKAQAGLSIPLWQWSYASQVKSARKEVEIARTQRKITSYYLNTDFSRAIAQYKQQQENLEYFDTVGLRLAEEILKSSKESYRLGSIGYYAYLQNLELAFKIEENYLESIKNYNNSINTINYITGQTNP